MERKIRIVLLLMIVFNMIACEKYSGGDGSVTGAWRCREESSSLGIRRYTVNIDRYEVDTSIYIIYNFYNLNDIEVYFHIKDTVATIIGTNGGYSVTGKGYISKNIKNINWEYSISGSAVNDSYINALYTKQ